MGEVQATFCATLADEWGRAGVTDAIICPGSRSTPMVLALARETRIRVQVRLDERSAGFFALGVAKATGRPVVICTTSGTAAAELHAAVVEAFHSGVPLLVCTADRPVAPARGRGTAGDRPGIALREQPALVRFARSAVLARSGNLAVARLAEPRRGLGRPTRPWTGPSEPRLRRAPRRGVP